LDRVLEPHKDRSDAHWQLATVDTILDLAIELEQHQPAGDAGGRRADRAGDGCLCVAFVHQALVATRFQPVECTYSNVPNSV